MMNKTKKYIIIVLIILLSIVVGLGITLASKNYANQNEEQESQKVKEQIVHVNDRGEKLENFSKPAVVDTVTEMLKEVAKDTNGRTIDERIALLDDDATLEEVFTEEAISYLNLQDIFVAEPKGKQMTGLSLLSVVKLIDETTGDIAPVLKEFENAMYIDPVAQISYVPLDLYVGRETGFSMEMVYTNGQWKYMPYHLIEEVKLADIVMQKTK